EGNKEKNPVIFVIAEGTATLSVNVDIDVGGQKKSVETDVKDIKTLQYVGEGMVLTGEAAHASVRAKTDMLIYCFTKEDIDEILTPMTRAWMIQDMKMRRFQNQNVNNIWGAIK
ncbi:unnamed protein product, partial [Choristocarpus tenellus]